MRFVITHLVGKGCFNEAFTSDWNIGLLFYNEEWLNFQLNANFSIAEIELAFDFSETEIDELLGEDTTSMKEMKWGESRTFYTKDSRKSQKQVKTAIGKSRTKTKYNRKSLICLYERGKKLKLTDSSITRLEYRLDYSRIKYMHLSLFSLDKNPEDFAHDLIPILSKSQRKYTSKGTFNMGKIIGGHGVDGLNPFIPIY